MSESEITPKSYCFQRSFTDVDDLTAEARHWDLDFRQLGRGNFDGKFLQCGVDGAHVVDAQFSLPLLQRGATPPGMRTVAVPAYRSLQCMWRGQLVTGNDLMVFPLGGELDSVSEKEFRAFTCSFPEHLLSALCGERQLNEFSELCGGNEVLRCASSSLED